MKSKRVREAIFASILALGLCVLLIHFDVFNKISDGSEFIVSALFSFMSGAIFFLYRKVVALREWKRRHLATTEPVEPRRVERLLSICAGCKCIRDDGGRWHQVEHYIRHHSEAEFTHSICPRCLDRLYPDVVSSDE
ncbi:MAG: hypothetical protein ACE5IY_05115 [bacterium]